MLKLFSSLSCINKKEKRKLAIAPSDANTSSQNEQTHEGAGDSNDFINNPNDSSISIQLAEESSTQLKTSPFVSKVLRESSFESASKEDRKTPIDFNTSEIKEDADVLKAVVRRRSAISITPSPIPEEGEYDPVYTQGSPLHRNRLNSYIEDKIYSPTERRNEEIKPKKLAEIYHATSETPSPSSSSHNYEENEENDDVFQSEKNYPKASRSFHSQLETKPRQNSQFGGSLRQIKSRRPSLPPSFSGRILQLEQRDKNEFRLRRRVDSSRRDAVEAGFEPRESVPRCHSTQSLKDAQRKNSYNKSQFLASDLSLNPNGHIISAVCDSTSGNLTAPTAVVNPHASYSQPKLHKLSRSTYDHQSEMMQDVDRRRSLQTITGASSLYQMTNGRSQFTPTKEIINQGNQGTRVRVSSVNQLCERSSSPHYVVDQRRSVHNINHPVRNSFADGIKTTSTPKNQIAVAPLTHKSRHLSESRDEMRSERRGSGGGAQIVLPAYQSYLMRHSGHEERLVDGPVNSSDTRIAYLEQRIRELELTQKEQQKMNQSSMTPPVCQTRHSRASHLNGNLTTSEQINVQELNDDLMMKNKKIAQLEGKLLKAYQRVERQNEEYEMKVKSLIYDGERARDDLTRCVEKIQHLERELEHMNAAAQNEGNRANDQTLHELSERLWKQEREIQENHVQLNRLREKEAEYEKMRSEKGYLELKNENLNKKLEAKKRVVEELERSVSTLRLEQTICQQSCSSGSTPLADDTETMSDIRPSVARPYTKAHSTLGSNMTPLPHSKSTGLTKSFSNFALNSSKRDDVTPMMSRSIREQNRHITMCRAMVVCLKDTVERLSRGENPDVGRLLGVKLNMMSESELDEDEEEADESKPFSMMSAESALAKQCQKLVELDKDLDYIRCQLAEWHGSGNVVEDGDRETCRVQ